MRLLALSTEVSDSSSLGFFKSSVATTEESLLSTEAEVLALSSTDDPISAVFSAEVLAAVRTRWSLLNFLNSVVILDLSSTTERRPCSALYCSKRLICSGPTPGVCASRLRLRMVEVSGLAAVRELGDDRLPIVGEARPGLAWRANCARFSRLRRLLALANGLDAGRWSAWCD
jgi:hypothetical protein